VQGGEIDNINFLGCFLAGGFAGVMSWLIPYPMDTVKTML
jgi:Mitochondrial carrier protein